MKLHKVYDYERMRVVSLINKGGDLMEIDIDIVNIGNRYKE